MYIKSVRLQNFQSYVDQTFEFKEGLNIVRGASFSGKSASIRALDYILYGGKCYEDYLRKGTRSFTIELTLDTGLKVVREKGKSINKYTTIENGIEQVYENFGTEVPAPVKKLLGISELVYDSDKSLKLNLVNQFDPLFLFTEPGSVRAKVIGLLSKIHLVDICLRGLNKDLRSIEDKACDLAVTLSRHKEEEKSYENLPKQLNSIQLMEQLVSKIEQLKQRQDIFRGLVELKKSIENNEDVLVKYKNLADSIDLDQFKGVLEGYQKAVELLGRRKIADSSQDTCKRGVEKLSAFRTEELERVIDRYVEVIDMVRKVVQVNRDLESAEVERCDCEVRYSKGLEEYKQGVRALGVCPVCSTKITEEVLAKHLEEL